MKKIFLAVLLCIVPLKAHSQASSSIGAGTVKCSFYNSLNEDQKNIFFNWVQGYMSGINEMTKAEKNFFINLNSPDFDYVAQQGLLKSFCLKNTNEDVLYQGIKILTQMTKMGLVVKTKP
ncbi:hypothetical protein KBX73_15020 [Acetobacter persici]|uniref:hypothetical protein n=1 Tax=Acetobacter persici TaxID=1076596 RepID=UPI001BA571BD|nr:hypothetical protein [Acetobacter persici]MBS1017254.1 hypothetical protein [Acetobacter persici]MCP9321051.1 hypothetical protein [Acetobacter persici]